MNKSVTFTVKIRTLVLAAVAFIAVVGISQTLIAKNFNSTAAPMGTNGYEGCGAVVMNGKVYAVFYGEGSGFYYKEATLSRRLRYTHA